MGHWWNDSDRGNGSTWKNHWWNDSERGNGSTCRRTCPSATLSIINVAWNRSQDSVVRGRQLTALDVARPTLHSCCWLPSSGSTFIFRVEKYSFTALMKAAQFHTKRRKISVRLRGLTSHMMVIHTRSLRCKTPKFIYNLFLCN